VAFEVRVNGQTVYKEDAQVTGVSVQSARGELYRAGISTEGVIDVVLETVASGGPIRLDQLEAAQSRAEEARREGQVSGNLRDSAESINRGAMQQQVAQDDTLRPGGPNKQIAQLGSGGVPQVDLAAGLDPLDYETLTARVNSFAEHGDAQKAVDDNPPQFESGTAESGASGRDEARREARRRAENPTPEEQLPDQPDRVGPTEGEFPIATESVQTPQTAVVPPPETTPEGNMEARKAAESGTTTSEQRSASVGEANQADQTSDQTVGQTSDQTPDFNLGENESGTTGQEPNNA